MSAITLNPVCITVGIARNRFLINHAFLQHGFDEYADAL